MKYSLLLWLSSFIFSVASLSAKLKTVYEWNPLDLNKISKQAGDAPPDVFNPGKVIPFDIDITSDERTFITTIPKKDVRYTLLTLSNDPSLRKPVMKPYPNSSWHAETPNDKDCNKLRAVSSIKIDLCNRLWVVDNGQVEGTQECPAKLVLINLKDDSLVKSYEIPKDVLENPSGKSYLVNPVIHTDKAKCDNFTVFLADTEGSGLINFDGTTFKRFNDKEFTPQLPITAKATFIPGNGIFPLEIAPLGENLFFAPFASHSLYAQYVKCIMNGKKPPNTGGDNVFDAQPTAFRHSLNTSVVFIGLSNNKLICWNRRKVLCKEDFVVLADDPDQLHNITSIKMVENAKSGQENIVVLAHPGNLIGGDDKIGSNAKTIKFRVLKGPVKQLIAGTACEVEKQNEDCPAQSIIGKIGDESEC